MITEIINKYGNFADALVLGFSFENNIHTANDKGRIEVIIHCMNSEQDYEWEKVKLIFEEVLSFRFIENSNSSSTVINAALIIPKENKIIFNFFPLILSTELKDDPASDFTIHCRKIKYAVIA
jgi:hypothetical protein